MNLKVLISATVFAMAITPDASATSSGPGSAADVRPEYCTNVWDCPRPIFPPGEAGPTEDCNDTYYKEWPHCQDGYGIFDFFRFDMVRDNRQTNVLRSQDRDVGVVEFSGRHNPSPERRHLADAESRTIPSSAEARDPWVVESPHNVIT